MSSAAKLRKYGRGTATVAAAALVMTSFGPAAFASWDDAPQTSTVEAPAGAGAGTIGLVDSDTATTDNQGATLVAPGKTGQKIGDVRFTLPNRFRAGDIIDLVLMDRSAVDASNGFTNSGPSTSVGFSGDPTVTVSTPQNDNTTVNADTDAGGVTSPNTNVGMKVDNPWAAGAAVAPAVEAIKPGVGPTFSATTQQDTGIQGKNRIRLTVTSDPSTGDPDARWVVTLSDLKVDLGANVTPGELRIVPFASNRVPDSQTYEESQWFQGNMKMDSTTDPTDRAIETYTVPAYVSPVTVSSELQNIVADGRPQAVGTISVGETVAYSMGNGTYRLNVGNAIIANEDATSIKVTTTGGPTTQQVGAVTIGAGPNPNYLEFTLTGADAATLSSIKVDGLLLRTTTPNPLQFSVTGGTISGSAATWLATPAGSGTAPAGAPAQIAADAALGTASQADIVAPLDELMQTGIAVAPSTRIGGNNRYETAAKIASDRVGGQYVRSTNIILASGENYADALSASYLSQRTGAPIVLTMRGQLPEDTREALRDHQVDKVFIVGGEAAVSGDVAAKLRETKSYYRDAATGVIQEGTQNLQVVRLGGTTRYTTNQLVNMYAAAWGDAAGTIGKTVYKYGEAAKNTAIFARGDNFPDALAAGVLTAGVRYSSGPAGGALPLILTEPGQLSESAAAQIDRLDVQHGLIVGDSSAVSDTVKRQIEDKGLTDTRLGGADRYATASAVNEFAMRDSDTSAANAYPGLGFVDYTAGTPTATNQITSAYIANGLKFPDALTAAPMVGASGQTLSLVLPNEIPGGTLDFLNKRAADLRRVVALGLGDVVSTKVLNDANAIVSTK